MIANGNNNAINNFEKISLIPNQIVMALIEDTSEEAENFWKLLCYSRPDAINQPNLTEDEKIATIWDGDSMENNYHIFYKPLIGSALDTGDAQTQLRLYRIGTNPTSQYEALINFQITLLTNEKESMVRYKGMVVERTDLMESLFLSVINGRDLGVGVGEIKFDKELSKTCASSLGINNAKTFYGRTLVMGLRFMSADGDNRYCG